METKILDRIISIASKYSGRSPEKLNADSSINFDLQIDGDDIEEMIAEIDSEFKLNFEGFDYSQYFNSESNINSFAFFLNIFRSKRKSSNYNYDFKLRDFVRWILNGYWEEE